MRYERKGDVQVSTTDHDGLMADTSRLSRKSTTRQHIAACEPCSFCSAGSSL
uniref:Uncharacterized protein n=1 Tax=Setaria italica TaxID=4555 RepID=K3XP91_SETIT